MGTYLSAGTRRLVTPASLRNAGGVLNANVRATAMHGLVVPDARLASRLIGGSGKFRRRPMD